MLQPDAERALGISDGIRLSALHLYKIQCHSMHLQGTTLALSPGIQTSAGGIGSRQKGSF
jgi:hypothetical protein